MHDYEHEKNMTKDPRMVMTCDCGDLDHMFVFTYYYDDKCPELILSVHLYPPRPWYRRIWRAITYVFGTRSKYGDFDEVTLSDKEQVLYMRAFLDAILRRWPREQ